MRNWNRFVLLLGLMAATGIAVGCRATPRQPSPVSRADSTAGDSVPTFVDLRVDNHNWSDVVIYLLHGGTRTRLGTVSTARSTVFRFPASYAFANRVSLLVTAIGSPVRFESERFSVHAGQRVVWTIENTLTRSSLLIR